MSKKLIIAIDGHSGCGKSSTAKALAKSMGYTYIDSGAMYRAVTLYFIDNGVDMADPQMVSRALADIEVYFSSEKGKNETYLNGVNVEKDIRDIRVSQKVSEVASISSVRKKMVDLQRKMGEKGGIVMDGRDIGTVVFPQADLKIFMTADIDIRAQRRQLELEGKGIRESFEDIKQNLLERDKLDSTREDSPLIKAKEAVEIDTSHLSFDDQLQKIINLAEKLIVHEN